jgi:tRNA A37 threonylcarbamoyladenosine synthetase subunit TsaC/SUA5/YrdC
MTDWMQALQLGHLTLLPTDTVPGLSFHPLSDPGWKTLLEYKGRAPEKPFIHLIGSATLASAFWVPLPSGWSQWVELCWQQATTVVWKVNPTIPKVFQAPDGTLALRVPYGESFLLPGLQALGLPVPTTSLNRSGEPAILTWKKAVEWVQGTGVYVPDYTPRLGTVDPQPSSVVRIFEDGSCALLREGRLTRAHLLSWKGLVLHDSPT